MEMDRTARDPAPGHGERLGTVAAAFRAGEQIYRSLGTPLYGALCAGGADDPDIIELASHGQQGAQPVHLFASVHYLLLRDPGDPLSRYFATLTDDEPASPEHAFPEFARYCAKHRDEILPLLENRTVELSPQTSYVRRLQHQLAEQHRVQSRSTGLEPNRRVLFYRGPEFSSSGAVGAP